MTLAKLSAVRRAAFATGDGSGKGSDGDRPCMAKCSACGDCARASESHAFTLGGYPLVVIHGEETAPAVASASTISFAGVEGFAAWLSALRDAI